MPRRLKLANDPSAGPSPANLQTPYFCNASRARAGDGTRNGGGGRIPRNGSPETLALTVIKHRGNSCGADSPYTSCAAWPLGRPAGQRGGARNSRFRFTEQLSLRQVTNLVAAAGHAQLIGLPFNRHLTILLEKGGISEDDEVEAIGRLLKLIADAVRFWGGAIAYAWVREVGPDNGRHVHILWHIPPGLARRVDRRMRRWRTLCGFIWGGAIFRTELIGRSLRHAARGVLWGTSYADELAVKVAYVCKGASRGTLAKVGLPKHKPGGAVVGKRSGTSQNIGRKARGLAARK